MLIKLLIEYYNYANVFNKTKANKLLLYYSYNYKIEFAKEANKNILSKSRIYFILKYKLK